MVVTINSIMPVVYMSGLPWSTDPADCGKIVTRTKSQVTVADLERIWDAGTPFFTKDAMRDVQTQIRNARTGDLIRVRSLLGTDVYFRVCTGEEVHPGFEPGRRLYVPMLSSTVGFEAGKEMCSTNPHGPLPNSMEPQIFWRDFYGLQAIVEGINMPLCSMILAAKTVRFTDDGIPISPVSVSPVPAARDFLARGIRAFADCQPRTRLEAALRRRLPRVKKIVAFANNSIAVTQDGRARDMSSDVQHALMLELRKILLDIGSEHGTSHTGQEDRGKKCTNDIALYAQDPAYTDVDRAVLGEHGIEIVDDPGGFLEVDEEAAVLSFSPNIPVRSIVADIALPAMSEYRHSSHFPPSDG